MRHFIFISYATAITLISGTFALPQYSASLFEINEPGPMQPEAAHAPTPEVSHPAPEASPPTPYTGPNFYGTAPQVLGDPPGGVSYSSDVSYGGYSAKKRSPQYSGSLTDDQSYSEDESSVGSLGAPSVSLSEPTTAPSGPGVSVYTQWPSASLVTVAPPLSTMAQPPVQPILSTATQPPLQPTLWTTAEPAPAPTVVDYSSYSSYGSYSRKKRSPQWSGASQMEEEEEEQQQEQEQEQAEQETQEIQEQETGTSYSDALHEVAYSASFSYRKRSPQYSGGSATLTPTAASEDNGMAAAGAYTSTAEGAEEYGNTNQAGLSSGDAAQAGSDDDDSTQAGLSSGDAAQAGSDYDDSAQAGTDYNNIIAGLSFGKRSPQYSVASAASAAMQAQEQMQEEEMQQQQQLEMEEDQDATEASETYYKKRSPQYSISVDEILPTEYGVEVNVDRRGISPPAGTSAHSENRIARAFRA